MKKIAIKILAFIVLPLAAVAQPTLPSESVEVNKKFDALLLDTEPERQSPFLPYIDSTLRDRQTYDVPSKNIDIDYPAPRLRPVAIKAAPKPINYKGYTKLGFGTPMSPYGEVAYNFVQKNTADVGVYFKHHSAWPSSADLLYRRFNNNNGGIRGNAYLKSGIAVGGDIGYGQRDHHYYGYDKSGTDTLTLSQALQRYRLLNISANAFNGERNKSDFNFDTRVNFYRLTDNYSAKETGADIRLVGTKWIANKHAINLGIRTDFTSKSDTSATKNLNNFYFQPSFTFHHTAFSAKVGLNLVSNDDNFYPLPDVELNANLLGNNLGLFAGWKGDFQKNTLRTFSEYNPFISPYLGLKNTVFNEYYGGVKGKVSFVSYYIRGGYGKYNDLAMYVTKQGDIRRWFEAVYDTVNVTKIEGNITATPVKDLTVMLSVGYNIYDPNVQAHAWHLPTTNVSASARYRLLDSKLLVRGELFSQGGAWVPLDLGDAEQLDAMLDLNLGVEYQVAKNVAVFIDGNNLLNNKYQRWLNYPQLGINVLGGVVARF